MDRCVGQPIIGAVGEGGQWDPQPNHRHDRVAGRVSTLQSKDGIVCPARIDRRHQLG